MGFKQNKKHVKSIEIFMSKKNYKNCRNILESFFDMKLRTKTMSNNSRHKNVSFLTSHS